MAADTVLDRVGFFLITKDTKEQGHEEENEGHDDESD